MRLQDIQPGMIFGRLQVLERAASRRAPCGSNVAYYRCVCVCGTEKEVRGRGLVNGYSTSCGCLRGEKTRVTVGQQFGRLRVADQPYYRDSKGGQRAFVQCECECGARTEVLVKNLARGISTSCGCLQRDITSETFRKHGESGSKLYGVWLGMKARCSDPKNKRYARYGGRGISVCAEWQDFAVFRAWAMANGYAAHLTIDRRDNDKGYSPDNCRWITNTANIWNSSVTVKVEWEGEIVPLAELAHRFGLRRVTVYERVKRGWPLERALTTPKQQAAR